MTLVDLVVFRRVIMAVPTGLTLSLAGIALAASSRPFPLFNPRCPLPRTC
ncbi:hypothetical protein ABZX92_01415 [Lentzea sp. NPDC006480]